MPCTLAMLGEDADLVIASWPYVTVDAKHYEMFVRKALAHGSGMVPSIGCDAGPYEKANFAAAATKTNTC